MSAEGATGQRVRGRLTSAGVAQLLQVLEDNRATARVRVQTDIGDGEIDIVSGQIVDSYAGNLIGRPALLSLLASSGGRFDVSYETLEARPALVPNVAHLLAENARRMADWRVLCEKAPPLKSVLELTEAGRTARDGGGGVESRVLALVDGRRTIAELIDESGLDAVEALRTIDQCVDARLLAPTLTQSSMIPIRTHTDPAFSPVVPGESPAFNLPDGAPQGATLRRRTTIGLGNLSAPEPVLPRNVTTHRIINVSVTPPPPPDALTFSPVGQPTPVTRRRDSTTPSQDEDTGPVGADEQGGRGQRFVGRYELLCRIGHGGMGSVYLCRLMSEGGFRRLFALKVLRSHLSESDAAAQRFLEEASLAGQIHHPNVVSVIDAGLHGTQPYLVMDYIEGGSLKQLLSSHPDVRPPALILPILLDALAGLHAAHSLVADDGTPVRLVHCDVSPENLLVGVDGVCRLTDFGVAKHGRLGPNREQSTHGKPSYLAPEQVEGKRVDHRADIFAMGVVLYNALTGAKLFDAPTVQETLRQVCGRPIEPPSGVGLRPSPVFDFVCMKALEREPDRRFASAEQMLIELKRIAMREDLLAPTNVIANWVRESVGRQLSQRRLVLLDASRRTRRAGTSSNPPPMARTRRSSDPAELGKSDPAASNEPVEQTIELVPQDQTRRWALIIASALAALAILLMLLWPDAVSRYFSITDQSPLAPEVGASVGVPAPPVVPKAEEPLPRPPAEVPSSLPVIAPEHRP
jgi:eukaryotic-like serine/threonine-protein kinase